MDRQCKKLHWSIYSAPDSAKKQQQQFTYGQTVQKSNSNLHMDSTYLQKGATDYAYAVSWMCIVWCPVIADRFKVQGSLLFVTYTIIQV